MTMPKDHNSLPTELKDSKMCKMPMWRHRNISVRNYQWAVLGYIQAHEFVPEAGGGKSVI